MAYNTSVCFNKGLFSVSVQVICLERLVSEMTYYVSSETQSSTHSLTHSLVQCFKFLLMNMKEAHVRSDLPRIGGGQSSPMNPHSGISGGGSLYIPQVSGVITVTIYTNYTKRYA